MLEFDPANAVPLDEYEQNKGIGLRKKAAAPDATFDPNNAVVDETAKQGLIGTLWQGTKSAGRAIGATVDAYTGDNQGIVDKAAAQQAAPKDHRVEKFYQDFAQRTEALGEDPGVLDTIGEGLGAVWDNPAGAGLAMVEQLPNAVPTLAGGYAGLKAGAAAGAVAGAPFAGVGAGPGAAIGGVLGGLAGMFLGNAAIETGHKAMGMADDGEVTDEERGQAIEEGAVKGAVITGVDAFTLGLGGKVAGTLNRTATTAVETATRKALLDRGVDVADEAAVLAAKSNPETFAAVRAAQENAIKATDTLKRRAAQAGTLFAMETVGEGVGEYLGEMAATGEGSVPDAVMESLLSAGQSGVETAWNMSRKSPNSAKWVQPTPSAENPNPAPVERPDPSAGPLSAAASLLPAPSIAGALPAPDQTLYGDGLGNVSPDGPGRDVDREYRPVPGREQPVRDFGPGMDQQYQQGAAPGIEGQLIRASRQQQAPAGREPQTFDAVESPRLPAPAPRIADGRQDAVIVDAAGNAVPGKLPGQQPEDYVQGGRGMDQQAPTRTFSNVLAAKNAISKSPNPAQLEVVPVGPKQFEIRSKRAVPTKGARKTVDREKDSVVQAIARLGGIKTEWRQDTTGEAKSNRIVPGVGALWTDKTGTSIDDMASLLQQNGYVPAGEMEKDGGVSWLQAAISDELSGRKTHLAPGSKRQEEETQQLIAQREADIAAQQEAAGDFDSAEVIVSDLLDDLDIMEIRAERARKFAEELDAIFEGGTNENSTSTASADNRPAEDARTENGAGGSAGAREPGPVQQPDARAESPAEVEAPSLELSSYTEQDLAAQAKLQAEAEAKNAAETKAVADKAQADRDLNDFTLSGSDRPADVATARGQNDMFAPPTRGERKTEQAQRNPVDYLREIVRQSNVPQTDAVGAARGAILNPDASAVERQALLEEVGATDAQSIAELDAALVKWWRRHFRARGEHKAKANADMAAFDQQRRDRDVEDTLELGRQAAADLDAQRTMVDAGSVADQLASMNVDDLSALIDSIAEQEAAPQTSKPKAKRTTKAKTEAGKPRLRPNTAKAERVNVEKPTEVRRAASEIAKSLGVNMSNAGMNALEGLTKLFGGPGRLNSGLSFDEETYAKAKPHFAAAMADIQAAGKDLRDFIRALLGQFGDGVKPYIMRYAQDLKQEQASGRTNQYLEPDRTANAEQGAGRDLRNDQPGEDGRRAEQLGEGQGGQRANDSTGVPGSGPAAGGERGDSQVDGAQSELAGRDAGSADTGRGGPDSTGGLYAGREADPAADRAIAQSVKAPAKANLKPSSKPGTLAEIKEQMPFLTEGQAEDVVFAEKRLSKPDGYGVLYTNGTGTGKTFSGLGIAARQAANGKTNILIVAPKQPIVDAWVKAGKSFFGLDIKPLESKQDNGGSGIVVTTFANLGDNNSLALREWDLVIADEAQYLSSDMAGSVTQALSSLRALTRRRGTSRNLVNMREADKVARMKALYASIESNKRDALESGSNETFEQDQKDQAEADLIRAELDELYAQEEAANAAIPPEQKPRAVFLSATPFAYEKNVVWAQEFLFDWGTDDGSSQAYNAGGPYERFMIQHFGYRMRYNKLNEPDAKVDRGLMQRAFNSWLKREGALSGRALDSEYDYDRLFVTVDSPIGRRVDEALKWLRDMTATKDANGSELHASEEEREAFNNLHERIAKGSFDYHARMYFLEAIKAREALPHIRAHLDAGRKVLVMHDFKKGGAVNPFRQSFAEEADQAAYEVFRAEFPDLIRAFDVLPSPIDQLSRAFPDALVYNGSYSAKKRVAMQDAFNSDADGSPRLMIAQGDAMREGVSIHDTTGKASRTMIHLGMPVKPTSAIQQEGRTYRTGQASNAMFRYFTIGTSWERSAFAGKIATRASAAENLAMGEQARGLKQAFIDAYENADLYEPGFAGEGTGGKAADRAAAAALTPWDMAKSFYFGTKKQGAGRSARGREGDDYFATPEPVGLKMVEWADIRGGESVLEPSAGHGAIARWFPDAAKVRVIEQSADLASRVALHVDGEVVHGNFEDHHIVNKYDAIVMNPPYGLGGFVAVPHLMKAADHLREGGRVVALMPTGPAADKRFDNWFYGLDKNGNSLHPDLHLVGDVLLPSVTFERAGTAVRTRLMIIEKVGKDMAGQVMPTRQVDLTGIDDIGELFDRMESMEMRARVKPVEEEAEQTAPAKSVEEKAPKAPKLTFAQKEAQGKPKLTTDEPIFDYTAKGSGKVMRGAIVRGISLEEVKEKYYKYAFKMDGGVFLREEFLQRPSTDDAPRFSRRASAAARTAFGRGADVSGAARPVLEHEAVKVIVDRIGARLGLGVPVLSHRGESALFAALPEIGKQAEKEGAQGQVRAVYYRGKVHVVTSAFAREADVEVAILDALAHEGQGHYGIRAMHGNDAQAVGAALREVFAAIGGVAGVKRLAEKNGLDLSLYLETAEGMNARQRAGYLVDELLAHLQGRAATAGLTERAKAAIRAYFGAVREWLRGHGFPNLAKGTDADIALLLKRMREAAQRKPSGRGLAARFVKASPEARFRRAAGVTTDAFKRWFGASKVVGQQGEPKILYHGTGEDFTVFDQGRSGSSTRHSTAPLGIFLTGDRDTAQAYADKASDGMPGYARVMQLYAAIRNPYMMTVAESQAIESPGEAVAFRAKLERDGYDGINLKGTDTWIAFSNTQVKSATDNNGEYDEWSGDIRFSRSAATEEALRKFGFGEKETDNLVGQIRNMTWAGLKAKVGEMATRSEEGLFDGLVGIKRAEQAVGVNDPNQQGYVSARLASGLADVIHGVFHYGSPEWRDGIVQRKAGTRGVLEILGELGQENLTPWLAWVGAKRAQMLKAEGRENNLSDQDITELLAMASGKEAMFERVYREYAAINEAVLDLAEGAGLINPESREKWATEYYVPFYRQSEADGIFTGPRTKRGLSHQTAAIKQLKGGNVPTNDLLVNILSGWTKRIDASLKNKALLETVDNLKGSDYLTDEGMKWTRLVVPRAEVVKKIKGDRVALEYWAEQLGLDETAGHLEIAHELNKLNDKGYEELWGQVAPQDPDIIRVQRSGKNEFYRVNDESLLRGLKFIEGSTFNDPITRIGRTFKRVLTTGVTASPDFILRNFIRDAAHAWLINKDGFTLGKDSIKGMRDAFREDGDYRDLMFAGASFQGGYIHGGDPEASADMIRRALAKKGMSRSQQAAYMSSLVNTPAKAGAMMQTAWEKYRAFGDKVENANRLSTYKAALAAGKSKRQAAYEAKDLMDFSLRGNFAAAQWFTDVVPFLNARAQGLYKLGRAMKGDNTLIAKEVAMKGAYVALFSLLLAGANGDDERYKALKDWDKDANWHFWFSDDQVEPFRIPKPFELGLIFGTVPERLLHAMTGNQDGGDLAKSVAHGVFQTLAFNPVPQFYQPIREIQANRNFFFDMPIEDMSDEGKLPEARYDERTSAIGRGLGQLTGPAMGLSPKQIDHLVRAYTGTLGGYVLSMSNLVAGIGDDAARPAATAGDIPVVKVLYSGEGVKSTQYQTEFYDMMQEAERLHKTIKAFREEGKVEEADQLAEENSGKLKHRRALGFARKQLGNVRNKMDAVYRDTTMDAAAKRERLNSLQKQANEIAKRVTELAGEDF